MTNSEPVGVRAVMRRTGPVIGLDTDHGWQTADDGSHFWMDIAAARQLLTDLTQAIADAEATQQPQRRITAKSVRR